MRSASLFRCRVKVLDRIKVEMISPNLMIISFFFVEKNISCSGFDVFISSSSGFFQNL